MCQMTKSEWQVMDTLWRLKSPTLAEIEQSLSQQGITWSNKTIHTFLTRLERKGIISIKRDATPHIYAPIKDRAHCERSALREFKDNIFFGSGKRLLLSFFTSEQIDEKEKEDLLHYIDESMK